MDRIGRSRHIIKWRCCERTSSRKYCMGKPTRRYPSRKWRTLTRWLGGQFAGGLSYQRIFQIRWFTPESDSAASVRHDCQAEQKTIGATHPSCWSQCRSAPSVSSTMSGYKSAWVRNPRLNKRRIGWKKWSGRDRKRWSPKRRNRTEPSLHTRELRLKTLQLGLLATKSRRLKTDC